MPRVVGWDIGGVNTKAAIAESGVLRDVVLRPFELQHSRDALSRLLADTAADLGPVAAHAVTMTAELSQAFRTKREGVAFVTDAVERAFAGSSVQVFTTRGKFVTPSEAREDPLGVAAANWVATATVVGRHYRHALLIDMGTTTTDLIPLVDGVVAATGRTDPARLASGELVYTGAVRTPAEAMVREVPYASGMARVSAEGFAVTGDAHLWLGRIEPSDFGTATPDGRPAQRQFAGERLARVVCADREMLDEDGITRIAQAIADEQIQQIATAIAAILDRHPRLDTAVVTGLGAAIAADAAMRCGLRIVHLASHLGGEGARAAPAAAVALLLEEQLSR